MICMLLPDFPHFTPSVHYCIPFWCCFLPNGAVSNELYADIRCMCIRFSLVKCQCPCKYNSTRSGTPFEMSVPIWRPTYISIQTYKCLHYIKCIFCCNLHVVSIDFLLINILSKIKTAIHSLSLFESLGFVYECCCALRSTVLSAGWSWCTQICVSPLLFMTFFYDDFSATVSSMNVCNSFARHARLCR